MKVIYFVLSLSLISFISCETDFASAGDTGTSTTQGSYANVITLGDFMYVINKEKLQTFSLGDPANPKLVDDQDVGFNIESLLHYKGNLFIGSAQAMYIYEILENGIPINKSITSYNNGGFDICANDPIAVSDSHAYASLSSRVIGECVNFDQNEIRVFDIADIQAPIHINTVEMDSPRGIALDGNTLFICEAETGLKVMDVSDPYNLRELYHFDGFKAFDVIANNGLLVVVGPEKIYEYDYSDIQNMTYLSEIDI